MRRIVIGFILLFLIIFPYLQHESSVGTIATSIFCISLIFFVGYLSGELMALWRLPKAWGFIFIGIITSSFILSKLPFPIHFLIPYSIEPLYNFLLGVIALYLGSYFELPRKFKFTIFTPTLISTIITIVAVALFIILVYFTTPQIFPAISSTISIIEVAMIIALLMTTTSPAAISSIIDQTKSEGNATNKIIQSVIVKNILVSLILGLLLAIMAIKQFSTSSWSDVLLISNLGGILISLISGLMLAGILYFGLRYFSSEILMITGSGIFFLVWYIPAVMEIMHISIKPDPILAAFIAGVILTNIGYKPFISNLKKYLPLIYPPFFVLLIYQINLSEMTLPIVGFVLFMTMIRMASIFVGTYLTADQLGLSRMNIWTGFVPQGEVVLFLLAGIFYQSETIVPIVMMGVMINLILGLIMFKMGFVIETEARRKTIKDTSQETDIKSHSSIFDEVTDYHLPHSSSTKMNHALNDLRDACQTLENYFIQKILHPRTLQQKEILNRFRKLAASNLIKLSTAFTELISKTSDDDQIVERLKDAVRSNRLDFARRITREIENISQTYQVIESSSDLIRDYIHQIERLPDIGNTYLLIQNEERFISQPSDSFLIRSGKLIKRGLRMMINIFDPNYKFTQVVPLNSIIKYIFSGYFLENFLFIVNYIGYQRLFLLKKSQIIFEEVISAYSALLLYLDGVTSESLSIPDLNDYLEGLRSDIRETFEFSQDELLRFEADLIQNTHQILIKTHNKIVGETEVVGTFERPEKEFNFNKIYAFSEQKKKQIIGNMKIWRDIHVGFCGRFGIRVELVMIEGRVRDIVDETIFNIKRDISSKFKQYLIDTKKRCQSSIEEIVKAYTIDRQQWMRTVQEKRDNLLDLLQQRTVQKIANIPTTTRLETLVDTMFRRFHKLSEESPEIYHILCSETLDINERTLPEPVEFFPAPIRETVRSFLEVEFTRSLGDINTQIQDEAVKISQSVIEATKVIEFNLGASLEEFDELPEDAEIDFGDLIVDVNQELPQSKISSRDAIHHVQKLAIGGIENVIKRLDELLIEVDNFNQRLARNIIQKATESTRHLEKKITKYATVGVGKREKKETLFLKLNVPVLSLKVKFQEQWQLIQDRWRAFRGEFATDVRHRLGIQTAQQNILEELTLIHPYHLRTDQQKSLPFIYQRLFSLKPLELEDFLIGREGILNEIQNIRQLWLRGVQAMIAIIGESGSGKTSLINVVLKKYFSGWQIWQIKLTKTVQTEMELIQHINGGEYTSFSEISEAFKSRSKKQVFVIENLHHLYLKKVGGFDLLKNVLQWMQDTSDDVLWVITIDQWAWQFWGSVINLPQFFTNSLFLEALSAKDVEMAINIRHSLSGFDLSFQDKDQKQNRTIFNFGSNIQSSVQTEAKEIRVRREFFRELTEYTAGNMFLTLFYWLKSIHQDMTQPYLLRIQPCSFPTFSFLNELDIENLLVLATLIQHENLTLTELSDVFGINQNTAHSYLSILKRYHLIYIISETENTPIYTLNPIVYRVVIQLLKKNGIFI